SPNPRNLIPSSSTAHMSTRVFVLPRSSPTANFVLFPTRILSYRRDQAVNTQIERPCIRALLPDLVVICQEIPQPLGIIFVTKHKVHDTLIYVLGDNQIVRIRHADLRDLISERARIFQKSQHPPHASPPIL